MLPAVTDFAKLVAKRMPFIGHAPSTVMPSVAGKMAIDKLTLSAKTDLGGAVSGLATEGLALHAALLKASTGKVGPHYWLDAQLHLGEIFERIGKVMPAWGTDLGNLEANQSGARIRMFADDGTWNSPKLSEVFMDARDAGLDGRRAAFDAQGETFQRILDQSRALPRAK